MKKNAFKKPPFSLDRTRRGDLAKQLAASLRTAIETGYYGAGDILPPVRDLALLLDVSKGIAEQALALIREEGLVSPRPCVGSVVCPKERPLWKGHVVIVVPPRLGNPFNIMLHAVLRDTLTAAGYLTTPATVSETRPGKFNDFSLLDTVLRQQTDLVVVIHYTSDIARWLSRRGIPFVDLAESETPPPNCAGRVLFRLGTAIAPFVARCAERKIGHVMQVGYKSRLDLSADLGAAGIRTTTLRVPDALYTKTGFELSTWAAETFSRHLADKGRGWLPDLIFFHDDHLATGALFALYDAGFRVPDDVRVATWANRNYGPVFVKPLSRMEVDASAIGEKLAAGVLEYLHTGAFPQGIVVGPSWIEGETF